MYPQDAHKCQWPNWFAHWQVGTRTPSCAHCTSVVVAMTRCTAYILTRSRRVACRACCRDAPSGLGPYREMRTAIANLTYAFKCNFTGDGCILSNSAPTTVTLLLAFCCNAAVCYGQHPGFIYYHSRLFITTPQTVFASRFAFPAMRPAFVISVPTAGVPHTRNSRSTTRLSLQARTHAASPDSASINTQVTLGHAHTQTAALGWHTPDSLAQLPASACSGQQDRAGESSHQHLHSTRLAHSQTTHSKIQHNAARTSLRAPATANLASVVTTTLLRQNK
jgi:hypothetical protein